MRQYRGNRIDNGEEVKGWYFEDPDGQPYIFVQTKTLVELGLKEEITETWHAVHPGSVGQSTGKTDEDGVEIYEGDITESKNPDFGYGHPDDEEPEMVHYAVSWSQEHSSFMWGGMYMESDMTHVKVIGNIRQNPGLLEEQ